MNRRIRLSRITPLRGTVPLQSRTPLGRTASLKARSGQAPSAATGRTGLRPVSAKRQQENRERRAMAARRFPERPRCYVPWCTDLADDLHEILTRARGGSITDEANTVPVCRRHNEELTLEPGWGYDLGLLRHSWDGPPEGRAA